MLTQKELQLQDLQEQRVALQAERDQLKGELQHLESLHCKALTEAREQAHALIVSMHILYSTIIVILREHKVVFFCI